MNDNKKYCYKYPRPAYTVDAIVIKCKKILLIKRKHYPFEGYWALPGGFMDMNETPQEAIIRELKEETNIKIKDFRQYKTYGSLNRDPRHRTITTVYYSISNDKTYENVIAGDDACEAEWHSIYMLPQLAFDHKGIIEEFIRDRGF